MLTRRRVLGYSALLLPTAAAQTQTPLRLAVIGNTYHYGSELQIIADRFLVGYGHEGDWHMPNVKVVSMFVESAVRNMRGAGRAKEFGFRLCRNIPEALRCGGYDFAVDAVLSVVEQGEYPRNHKGQVL